jgi:hypothetical protein
MTGKQKHAPKRKTRMYARREEAGKRYTVFSESGLKYIVWYSDTSHIWYCNCVATSVMCRHIERVHRREQFQVR